ncbi:CRISPR-associated endonuclease Cas1 [uncultured Thiohalocapsa sp.]|uniref:CRISPR-associated endonuclease Cas1 n=1 Tax=uncultured Thiohalocapsa sp. TaxID=768990 RepID=UPI0025FD9436|nr:CRISPR-associated endonuclease Cas1 [uncultured Thiohalocapsa sp.]
MTTLYLDRRDLALKLEGNALAIYAGDARRGTVPLHLLERVVMHSAVTLHSSLLARLADAGVGILAFGGRSAAKTAIVQGKGHNDGARRVGQYRRYDDPGWCRAWARRLVRGKLVRQERLLRNAQTARADLRHPLRKARERLAAARSRLRAEPDLGVDALRGIEGAAAAAYFGAYTRLFAPALDFTARNRRPPRDPVNAALSLGYTLLHYDAVRACHVAGLDPIIGFYHRLDFARESLASDLIEPLRPAVDAWVWAQFRERGLRAEHFEHSNGACLLGKTGRARFYAAWERFARPRRRLLRRFAQHLAAELARAAPPPEPSKTHRQETGA